MGKEQKALNSLWKTGERGRQSIPLCRKKAKNCLWCTKFYLKSRPFFWGVGYTFSWSIDEIRDEKLALAEDHRSYFLALEGVVYWRLLVFLRLFVINLGRVVLCRAVFKTVRFFPPDRIWFDAIRTWFVTSPGLSQPVRLPPDHPCLPS